MLPYTSNTSLSCKENIYFRVSVPLLWRCFGTQTRPKGVRKDTNNLPTRCLYFREKTCAPTKTQRHPKRPPTLGPESFLGSPKRPQGHPIVPRGSRDPPRRLARHPYGTVSDHFASHFGPFLRNKFRYEFRSKFSTSSLHFGQAMSTSNLLLIYSPYQIRCAGSGNTSLPHKVLDFLYLHTVGICFGALGPQIVWFRPQHCPKQSSASVSKSVLRCMGLDIVQH